MLDFTIGLISSFLISFIAYKKSSLNISGFLAATILGTAIYFFGGLWFFNIMIGFFISSSFLTKFKNTNKNNVNKLNEKGGKRDYIQVFVNGGIGLILAFLHYIYKEPIFLLAYSVSFGVATSDTWASEIGVLSKNKPLSILNLRTIERGMSGGISTLGTVFSFLGSAFIAIIFFIAYIALYNDIRQGLTYFSICLILGFIGSIIDSILGASIQAQYYCESTKSFTERKIHKNKPNRLVKGYYIVNNDAVNFASNLISTLIVFWLY
ncbi:DUF92 domain-containing protein [Tissierella pigra]|uniref:DUF92 domain-containing protein n=1 Tax=Tissierella pigra TaxID=2607614 RepID=A0A6N7XHM7_9FIRM|nr:DUF92 domain-containing protein [Tissierella pigra]MSU00232.1 DUF92 domain-containing protein [Tissierella pigra]